MALPLNILIKKAARAIISEIFALWEGLWTWIPGRTGRFIRKITIAPFLRYSGSRWKGIWLVEIPEFVSFFAPWNIFIDGYVRFGKYSQINAADHVFIGKDVMMGPYVMLTTVNHDVALSNIPMRKMPSKKQPIHIGENVWIGGKVTILPGSNIPSGSVIAAAAVFHKRSDGKENSIYAGIPAKVIGKRK